MYSFCLFIVVVASVPIEQSDPPIIHLYQSFLISLGVHVSHSLQR